MRQHLRGGEGVTEPTVETLLDWAEEGQRRLEEAIAGLSPDAVGEPSALPGWTRGHVITHLARNADALINLLTWARTGEPNPMYSSPDQRNSDIEAGAGRALDKQLADLTESGRRLADAAAALLPEQWSVRVKSAQGRDIPAAEVPWMRVREVWIHLVDLDTGFGVEIIPDAIAAKLVREVAGWMSPKVDGGTVLRPDGHPAVRLGQEGESDATVAGPANLMAGWLIGRSGVDRLACEGDVPALPRWL